MLQEMPPGLKEKNEQPRAIGDPASKAMKRRLADAVDDPFIFRSPQAHRASLHIHQLLELAMARSHKPRAFTVFMQRLPPIAARAALEAAEGLEAHFCQFLPPVTENQLSTLCT